MEPRDEVSLRPLRQPDEAADRRSAGARLAVGRLLLSRVRLRDGDADQSIRDAARPVARRADRPSDRARDGHGGRQRPAARPAPRRRREWQVPVRRDDGRHATRIDARAAGERPRPVDVRRRSAAREHPRVRPPDGADRHREIRPRQGVARSGRDRSSTRPATSSACRVPNRALADERRERTRAPR